MSNFKRSSQQDSSTFQQDSSTFAPAKFWINLGTTVNGKVITLPVGIPIGGDTKARNAEQAALLEALLEMARSVPAGQQQELSGLQVFVRHVDDAPVAAVNLGLKLKLK